MSCRSEDSRTMDVSLSPRPSAPASRAEYQEQRSVWEAVAGSLAARAATRAETVSGALMARSAAYQGRTPSARWRTRLLQSPTQFLPADLAQYIAASDP